MFQTTTLMSGCSMHYGKNKAPIPKPFDKANKQCYKTFTKAYLSFIDECYGTWGILFTATYRS